MGTGLLQWGNKVFWSQVVVIVVQLCEYTKTAEFCTFKSDFCGVIYVSVLKSDGRNGQERSQLDYIFKKWFGVVYRKS